MDSEATSTFVFHIGIYFRRTFYANSIQAILPCHSPRKQCNDSQCFPFVDFQFAAARHSRRGRLFRPRYSNRGELDNLTLNSQFNLPKLGYIEWADTHLTMLRTKAPISILPTLPFLTLSPVQNNSISREIICLQCPSFAIKIG